VRSFGARRFASTKKIDQLWDKQAAHLHRAERKLSSRCFGVSPRQELLSPRSRKLVFYTTRITLFTPWPVIDPLPPILHRRDLKPQNQPVYTWLFPQCLRILLIALFLSCLTRRRPRRRRSRRRPRQSPFPHLHKILRKFLTKLDTSE
jgi:hypothetical protein